MTGWHIAHLISLAAWAGLVLGELALELTARADETMMPAVVRLHRVIDLFVEAPLLGLVLLSGTVLLLRSTWDTWLLVKVALGLLAWGANAVCVAWVLQRARAAKVAAPPSAVAALSRRIYGTVVVGLPAALVALFLGAQRAGWL